MSTIKDDGKTIISIYRAQRLMSLHRLSLYPMRWRDTYLTIQKGEVWLAIISISNGKYSCTAVDYRYGY